MDNSLDLYLNDGEDFAVFYINNDKFLYDSLLYANVDLETNRRIYEEVIKLKNSEYDYNKELAGDIRLEKNLFEKNSTNEYTCCNIDKEIAEIIESKITNILKKCHVNCYLRNLWVNFQEQYEYNPLHVHDGDYSFVWYVDVPEIIRREYENSQGNMKGRGSIYFTSLIDTHVNILNNIKTGDIIIFNAEKPHAVNPFYSDALRISISGNLYHEQ